MTQPLDSHTIIEIQSMISDLLANKVCELESDASEATPTKSKQLECAATQMDFMKREIFLLLHEVWDQSIEEQLRIHRPTLPEITPLSKVEVV